jgi:ABC-type transport system involved in cytochrome bd biosynthesis fused ATPase/permease subunit
MPLIDLFWTMLLFFLFIAWIWLLISTFTDVFRSEMSGWMKALWVLFLIILPFLGVLIYLIAHGSDVQDRAVDHAASRHNAQLRFY